MNIETIICVTYLNGAHHVYHNVHPDSIIVRDNVLSWETETNDDILSVPLSNVRLYTSKCVPATRKFAEVPF